MLGYIVHLFWAAWEVVWYLVRIFIFREPVSPALYLVMYMKCLLIEHSHSSTDLLPRWTAIQPSKSYGQMA